jgi:hypothetical protein
MGTDLGLGRGGRGKEGEGGKGWGRKGKGRKADAIILENRQTTKPFFQFSFFFLLNFPFEIINEIRMNPTV